MKMCLQKKTAYDYISVTISGNEMLRNEDDWQKLTDGLLIAVI